jgi:hypothetical protein
LESDALLSVRNLQIGCHGADAPAAPAELTVSGAAYAQGRRIPRTGSKRTSRTGSKRAPRTAPVKKEGPVEA